MTFTTQETTLANWSFKKAGADKWLPSKHGRPTTEIHVDLLDHGEIPDPFLDLNEKAIQWVAEEEWEYQTTIEISKARLASGLKTELVYEGLDTVATVYVNETEVVKTDNMFQLGRVDITKVIKEGTNTIRIFFANVLDYARALEKKHGKKHLWNAESCRVHIRKSQYHFGWDWGPVMITCGPYRPVKIVTYSAVIKDVFVDPVVDDSLDAKVSVSTDLTISDAVSVEVTIHSGTDKSEVLATKTVEAKESGVAKVSFDLVKPKLWYPANYGSQDLHAVQVQIKDAASGKVLQTIEKTVGFRRVRLVQRPLLEQEGTSFFFEVNGVPVYCAGSCWIPAHSLTTLLTEKDYREWVELMVNGHQNMVRVWGGGIYEDELFYQECDRQGLMVWQDFMFACGQYPAYPEFLESVTKEVEDQLVRLRNFCSIVLWCGNNEDYQVAESFDDMEYNPEDTTSDFTKTTFPARHIYEVTLPPLVEKYCPAVPYHYGSPWGGKDTKDPTVGDIHQWNVWHGSQEKYQDWYKLGGRFVSEFGMEALPDRKTVDAFITEESEKYPQSTTMDLHNKSDGFERRLALYVMENLKVEGMDLDSWIYATQLMQSECLAYAYRCWRRQWKGPGREYIAGALVWQINDCWPVTSWAIVDFYRRPKLSYYAIKRESKPVWIGMYRNERYLNADEERRAKEAPTFDYFKREHFEDIWGVNNTVHDKKVILHVEIFEATSGELVETLAPRPIVLKANQSTEITADHPVDSKTPHIVYCRLVDAETGAVIARGGDWPQPLKYLKMPNRKVTVKVEENKIHLSTNKPVKGVAITIHDRDLFLEDNGVDLFPGDDQTIAVPGLTASDKVSIRHY